MVGNFEKRCGTCQRLYKSNNDFVRGTSRWRVCSKGNLWFNCKCDSTLFIPKGKYPWYSPELSMGSATKSVFNTLANRDRIPHIPACVAEAQAILGDPSASSHDIAMALRADPLIAAELVKLANIQVIGSGNVIHTIEHALVFVGRKAVSNLVATAALKTISLKTNAFSASAHWREASLTGKIAEALCLKYLPGGQPEQLYLAGCLVNIGKIVTGICEPEQADRAYLLVVDPDHGVTWTRAEATCFATSHIVLGEIVAALWGFPVSVAEIIARHHQLPRKGEAADASHLVALANQLAHVVAENEARGDKIQLAKLVELFGMSDQDMNRVIRDMRGHFSEKTLKSA